MLVVILKVTTEKYLNIYTKGNEKGIKTVYYKRKINTFKLFNLQRKL